MPVFRTLLRAVAGRPIAIIISLLLPLAAGAGPRLAPPPPFVPGSAVPYVIAVLPGGAAAQGLTLPFANAPSSDTTLLSQNASAASVAAGEVLTYTVWVTNATQAAHTFRITDTLPSTLSYLANTVPGFTYNGASHSLTATETLAAFHGELLTTTAPAYTEIGGGGNPSLCQRFVECDDDAVLLGGVPFRYLGVDYSSLVLSTNGFVIPGSVNPFPGNVNQNLPNSAAPNGVIAPFWDDLDLNGSSGSDPGGGDWFYGTRPCNNSTCLVVEWRDAQKKGDSGSQYSFEVWIQLYTEHITFAYQSLTGITNSATIGFENSNGTLGRSYLFNGTGSVPGAGDTLVLEPHFDVAVLGYRVQAQSGLKGCSTLTNPIQLTGDGVSASASALTAIFGPCLYLPAVQR